MVRDAVSFRVRVRVRVRVRLGFYRLAQLAKCAARVIKRADWPNAPYNIRTRTHGQPIGNVYNTETTQIANIAYTVQ